MSILKLKPLHKILFMLAAAALSPAAFGQALDSTASTVALTATLAESLTVTATPATLAFALTSGGVGATSAPVAITAT